MTVRIVSAGVTSGAYPKSHNFDLKRCLVHAVEIDASGHVLAVLCPVKPASILPDLSQYNLEPVTCAKCLATIARRNRPKKKR